MTESKSVNLPLVDTPTRSFLLRQSALSFQGNCYGMGGLSAWSSKNFSGIAEFARYDNAQYCLRKKLAFFSKTKHMKTLSLAIFTLFLGFPFSACAAIQLKENLLENENFWVKIESCGLPSSKVKVVIFPPTGGSTTLEKWYSEKICTRGAFVLVVTDWKDAREEAFDPELHDRHLLRALQVYETLEKKWGGPFRVLGTSLGGLYAAAISLHHPWDKMVLITSGGPLSQVLSTSDQKPLIDLKEKRMKLWNLKSDKEYEAALGEAISNDFLPPRFQSSKKVEGSRGGPALDPHPLVPSSNIILSIAHGDDTVPHPTQEKLWESLGRPQRFDFYANHFWAIVGTYWNHSNEIADFLVRP